MKSFALILLLIIFPGFNILIKAQPSLLDVEMNTEEVGKYGMLELDVSLSASFTNPYNYAEIELKGIFSSPGGVQDTVDGFYCQDYIITDYQSGYIAPDGNPSWKIRYSPDQVGTWQFQVYCTDVTGVSNTYLGGFSCVESTSKGFIRKANDRFLKFDDGSQFFPIGENMGWPITNAIVDYRTWIDSLSANGGNLIRIWMASWSFALEWNDTPLRNYANRQDRAFYLDWIVDYASSKGVYIELCLNNHGQVSTTVNPEWEANPYNYANGGPCLNTWDFFMNTTAKDHYKNKMRYLIARWGYAPGIFSWEKFNEVDWTDNFASYIDEVRNWTNEMASYMKSFDIYDHLISTSYAQDVYDSACWQLSVLDYTQTHYYVEDPELENIIYAGTQKYLEQFDKPTKNGEYGLFTDLNNLISKDPDGIYVHNVTWNSAFSGGFGTAMSWWWDNYIHPQGIYRCFKPVHDFFSTIDLLSEDYTSKTINCLSESSIPFSFSPLFWVWDKSPENEFIIYSNGSLSPDASQLGRYLFGNSWNTEYRNPPTFHVNYSVNGVFSVKTAGTTGESPTIEIWLDGVLVFNSPATVNQVYSIDVPAGLHTLFIDNKGTDWIEIAEYILDPYIPVIKSNALVSQRHAYGWVHNRNYNWENIYWNGVPLPALNSKVIIDGLEDGFYSAEFFDCLSGMKVSESYPSSIAGSLTVECPDVLWDYAYKISYRNPLEVISNSTQEMLLYPNPVIHETKIEGCPPDAIIQVYDLNGRLVLTTKAVGGIADLSNLKAGVYLLSVITDEQHHPVKLVKM